MDKYNILAIANKCAEAIRAHHVDGQTLALLRPMDWCQLITTVGPRVWAMHVTKQLQDAGENQDSAFSESWWDTQADPDSPTSLPEKTTISVSVPRPQALTVESGSLRAMPSPDEDDEEPAHRQNSVGGTTTRHSLVVSDKASEADWEADEGLHMHILPGNQLGLETHTRSGKYSLRLGPETPIYASNGSHAKTHTPFHRHRAQGFLSQVADVNIVFAYPIPEVEDFCMELARFGAFLYLDQRHKVVQINLLNNLPSEGASTLLPLSDPFPLPPAQCQQLKMDHRRLQRVAVAPRLAPSGTQYVGWLEPGEHVLVGLGRKNPHGAFVYIGGEMDVCRNVVCNRDLCCGQLRHKRASRAYSVYNVFLPDAPDDTIKGPPGLQRVQSFRDFRRIVAERRGFGKLWRTSPVNNAPVLDDSDSNNLDRSLPSWKRVVQTLHIKVMQYLFNWYTILLHICRPVDLLGVAFAIFMVWICQATDLHMNYSPGLVTAAIIFPISFAINAAHHRRGVGLEHLATFKASCLSILVCHCTWAYRINPASCHTGPDAFVKGSVQYIRDLQSDVRAYLDTKPPEQRIKALTAFYQRSCAFAAHMEILARVGVPPPLLSKLWTDLGMIMKSFESLRIIRDYRTPTRIKAYIYWGRIAFTVFQAPYWAWFIKELPDQAWLAYFGAVMVFFFLHWLSSVQQKLEMPFKHGQDDINLSTFRVVDIFEGNKQMSVAPA